MSNIYSFLEISKEFFDSIHSPFYDEVYNIYDIDEEDLENKVQLSEKQQDNNENKKKKEKQENYLFLLYK